MSKSIDYEKFFNHSYSKCRESFLGKVNQLKQKYNAVFHKPLKVQSKTDNGLFIDSVHLKTRKENNYLIIISSGLHGVEGIVGSALQNLLIDMLVNDEKGFHGIDFLFIHAINPWGMKNQRRVNENNVDLNRNFSHSKELFQTKNTAYTKLEHLLNSQKTLSTGFIRYLGFISNFLIQSIIKSKQHIREPVGVGQYKFEKGIIFGGKDFQEEKKLLHPILELVIQGYKTIIGIDLHTGLGKRGELYILNAPGSNKKVKEITNKMFNGKVVADDDENFYQEHGSFLDFISSLCVNDQLCLPVMFEFGTINTDTLKGSAKLLVNTAFENQGYHYGYRKEKDKIKIKKDYKEMFYPSSLKWRTDISKLFIENILTMFENII